tara:strand:- start:142 stop:639 length:498 start_codon:yes stop_codon:yes gene_type:complete
MKAILAVDNFNGISKKGMIPWHKPNDLKFFKKITTQTYLPNKINAVLMGRKTWESLPRKFLLNRINIVLTRNPIKYQRYQDANLIFVSSIIAAKNFVRNKYIIETLWVIGGAEIYNEVFLDKDITDIFVTKVNGNFNCDKFVQLPKMKEINRSQIDDLTFIHLKN